MMLESGLSMLDIDICTKEHLQARKIEVILNQVEVVQTTMWGQQLHIYTRPGKFNVRLRYELVFSNVPYYKNELVGEKLGTIVQTSRSAKAGDPVTFIHVVALPKQIR